MTARDEAIDAMEAAHSAYASWEQVLDAIPPNVLARLAIEQGALEPMEWVDIVDPDVPLYRVVGP